MSNIPNRRRPRISNPKPNTQAEEDYCEDGEDMDSDDVKRMMRLKFCLKILRSKKLRRI